jgi:hypothetical protein
VVFTVPAEIEVIAFQNQTVVYDILFRAASEALRTIAADPKERGWDNSARGDRKSSSRQGVCRVRDMD